MSFDPESVRRFVPRDWTDGKGGSAMRPALKGSYVFYDDYESLLSLLHEVSTDADPAGTVRENIALKETVKALETVREETIDLLAEYFSDQRDERYLSDNERISVLRQIHGEVYRKHRVRDFTAARIEACRAVICAAINHTTVAELESEVSKLKEGS